MPSQKANYKISATQSTAQSVASNAAKKATKAVITAEKQVVKLEKQLIAAHTNKVSKLSKQVNSLKTKIKQSKLKRSSLSNKKTASAEKQKKALKLKINKLNAELEITKENLSQAKIAFKHTREIEKAINRAKKLLGKTVLRKKKVKKVIKKSASDLTPDLSIPVDQLQEKPAKRNKSKKPSKIWKPASTNKTKKGADENAELTVNPIKKRITKQKALKSTQVKSDAPLKESVFDSEAKKNVLTETTKITETPEAKEKIGTVAQGSDHLLNIDRTEPLDKTLAETSDKKSEEIKKTVTNWHTMPILRQHDD